MLEAGNFVASIENKQGLKIGCLEEVAFLMEYVDIAQLKKMAEEYKENEYGKYLKLIANEVGDVNRVLRQGGE